MCRSVLALLLSSLAVAPLTAQETKPRCRFFCGISVENELYLGDGQAGVISGGMKVQQLGDEFFVTHRDAAAEVMVFDSRGDFIRSFGRRGVGPGEFQRISSITAGPDGDLWIHDGGNGRMTIVDRVGRTIREVRFPMRVLSTSVVVLPDSSVIFNGHLPSPELAGMWVHRLQPFRADRIWSIEDERSAFWGSAELRPLTMSSDGELFIARGMRSYRIEKRDIEGNLLASVSPQRKWFEEWEIAREGQSSDHTILAEPEARIFDIGLVGGRLVVVGVTGDSDWRKAREAGFLDVGKRFDSVIEVFDPATLELLASRKFDLDGEIFVGFTNTGDLISWKTDPYVDQLGIWSLSVR